VFSASECIRLRRWKSVCVPNFNEISQPTAEIKLLPVSENGLPPYWNFTSDFDCDLCLLLGMWFCFSLPNFVIIRRSKAGLWRQIDFTKWRPYSQKSTSEFRFSDGTCLRRCVTTYIPNFDEISQCTAEIKLLPVSGNGRPPYSNRTSGFDFYLCVVIGMLFCIHLPNFVASRLFATELWRHINFSRWRP